MTARPCRSLLAGAGIAALALVPLTGVAATASESSGPPDDAAQQTTAPGDDAAITEAPGQEPEDEQPVEEPEEEQPVEEPEEEQPTTEDPADGEPPAEEPGGEEPVEEPGGEEPVEEPGGGEPVEEPGDEEDWGEWWDFGDLSDPALWEELLTEEGFVGVTCTADDTGYEVYELVQEAPEGKDWLLAVLFSDVSEEETWFDLFVEPWVGDEMWLEGENAQPLPLSLVILCAADIEASPADPGDIDPEEIVPDADPGVPAPGGGTGTGSGGGAGGGTGSGASGPGPVVETDVPAPGPGAGIIAGLAAAAAAAGTTLLGRRGWARR